MDKNSPILIVGAGVLGLSTAYHLAKAGYTSITVLEKSATFPPEKSAGNDVNKIIRAEYEDAFYMDLSLKAIETWKTPLFAPYYHENGYLLTTTVNAPAKPKATLAKSLGTIQNHPAFRGKITPITSRDDIRKVAPAFDGPMEWRGYFNRLAGYGHAADAMSATYSACCALGVDIRLGEAVRALTYGGDVTTCTGAVTTSGRAYRAARTVLTLGASVAGVLPEIAAQVTAKAWAVAHVQLTPAEAARLRGLPVTYARDLGFFFEPDARTGLLKLCTSGAGYTNYVADGVSLPPDRTDFIPEHDVRVIRQILRETLPALADRPLINRQTCWCADTVDTEYIIDFVPGKKNLVVFSGDSGHAFKMLPIAGEWVKDVLEQGHQAIPRWRWKDAKAGAGVASWRVGETTDIKDVEVPLKSNL